MPVSASGTNMLVTRQAYEATRGYENMPFSISEDYQLFREIVKRGFTIRQLFAPDMAVETEAMATWDELRHQRKRWTNAAMHTTGYIRLLTLLLLFLIPVILVSFLIKPLSSLLTWMRLLLVQSLFTFVCIRNVQANSLYK